MADNAVDLRLAAILALDVVGFSAMMNHDELGTLRQVQSLQRDIIAPLVGRHSGCIFKLIGDGVLAHFAKVDDAFACGKDILSELTQSKLGLRVRIGIHCDYVFFEDGDVFGDGVNIAARLEGSAFPGSIALSEKAKKDLSLAVDPFQDLGKLSLKNIRDPVRVFVFRPGYTLAASRRNKFLVATRRPVKVTILATLLIGAVGIFWNYYYFSPERVGKAALSGLACSWLGLQRAEYVNGVPFLELEGAALQDRLTLANKIRADVAREARSEVQVDLRNVSALPKVLCGFVERFKGLRYDGPRRVDILDVQNINYFTIDLRGRKASKDIRTGGQGYRLKLKIYREAFRPFSQIFAIHNDGSVSELALIRRLESDLVRQEDGSTVMSLSTDTTVNAVLLIDSARFIPPSVVVDSKLDVRSLQSLEEAATDGDWNVELLWFGHDMPTAATEGSKSQA